MTINAVPSIGFFLGALFISYLILRFCLYICRKYRKKPNGVTQIVIMGVISLGIVTILAGFGFQDDGPRPLFVESFFKYLGPVTVAIIIEMVRNKVNNNKALN